tara:strand:- start:690 stop:1259 length:570 start_codon:yes stop_codon:yes gene_type:complete
MCDPVSIGIAAAQTGMSIGAQKKQAKAQKQAQKAGIERENIRFRQEMSAKRIKEAQDNKIAVSEITETIEKTRQAKATARVSAGEAGVSGQSVQQLLNSFERQEAQALFAISEQQAMGRVNTLLQDEQSIFSSENRISQINQPIEQPDYLGAAVNLAGQGMGIYKDVKAQDLMKSQLKLNELKITEMGG